MRSFLSHEYGNIDNEAIFDTVKNSIPDLFNVTCTILKDVEKK